MEDDPSVDWKKVPEDTCRQVLTQGETYLQAQLQCGIAADQRATTFATFFAAIATAILAAALAYWEVSRDGPLLAAGVTAAVGMIAGAGMCLWASRPVDFYFPGNHPAHWFPVAKRPLSEIMAGEAENYQEHIERNEGVLLANSRLAMKGAALAIAAPLIAALVWAAATSFLSFPAATASADSRSQSFSDEMPRASP